MSTDSESRPLRIEDPSDILLLLLYAPGKSGEHGEPIDSITRLQKLVFLFQEEKTADILGNIAEYQYNPDKFGPYSSGLVAEIEQLKSAGIIRTKKLEYTFTDDSDDPGDFDVDIDVPRQTKQVESSRYYLSRDLGMRIGEELWENLSKKEQKKIQAFKSFFNSITLRQLLLYTYDRHADYTGRSLIKDSLGS